MWTLAAPVIQTVTPESDSGGVPWWIFLVIAVVVLGVGALLLVLSLRKGAHEEEVPCRACGKILLAGMPQCVFCKAPRDYRPAMLQVVSGPMQGRTIPLDGDVTTIGSAPGSTVTLTDGGVSRKHAGIRKDPAGYELADLGSTNGVYVNGEKVAKKRLQLGDVIRVGTSEMVFKN